MSPLSVMTQPQVDVLPVEQRLSCLPPLQHTFEFRHTSGGTEAVHLLELREAVLGAATLSGVSLRLLYEIASLPIQARQSFEPVSAWHTRPLHERIVSHAASHSAAQTQAVLPPGALVQKTVTGAMAGWLLLCTCVGDREPGPKHLRAVAHALALPRRAVKRCSINPATCDPVEECGMLPGMVSPFVSPLLGGLICVQERLDPCIALSPGWLKVYTCLQVGQERILLLCSFQIYTFLQREKDISPLEIALLHELCPDQGERGVPRLDAMLVHDGAIYAGYLVQLLCAVIETAFPPAVLPRGAAL